MTVRLCMISVIYMKMCCNSVIIDTCREGRPVMGRPCLCFADMIKGAAKAAAIVARFS